MRNLLLFAFLFCVAFGHAQDLKRDQFLGYIITDKGKEKHGIVKVPQSYLPWSFQGTIKFLETDDPKKALSAKKVKFTKYKPKDIAGYSVNGKIYKRIEYKDYSKAGNASEQNNVNKAAAMTSALTKSVFFMEEYRDGIISVYKYYSQPPGFSVTVGEEDAAGHEAYVNQSKRDYDIILKKRKEKPKPFNDMSVKKYFKDCDYVLTKFKNEEYTKKPVKGLGSLIKDNLLLGEALRAAAYEMIEDYEAHCAK